MKCLSFQKKTRFKWKKLNTKYRKLLQSWLQKKNIYKRWLSRQCKQLSRMLNIKMQKWNGWIHRPSLPVPSGKKGLWRCSDKPQTQAGQQGCCFAREICWHANAGERAVTIYVFCSTRAIRKKHGGSRSSWNQLLPSTNGSVPRDCDLITFTLLSSPREWVNT